MRDEYTMAATGVRDGTLAASEGPSRHQGPNVKQAESDTTATNATTFEEGKRENCKIFDIR